jgi:DNA-binding transcriptional ArsR family regulator
MSDRLPKKDSLEVSSQTLQAELAAIRDRLSAIETIQSISNVVVVKKYVEEHLTTTRAKEIMRECEEPRTRSHLKARFDFKSLQALDHHLKPLREADLVRERVEEDGTILFEWSNLFRRLPKTSRSAIMNSGK